MRSNHLFLPAVSLLGLLLAMAGQASIARAKTCFCDAVYNNSYSEQGKADANRTHYKTVFIDGSAYNGNAPTINSAQVIADGQNSARSLLRSMAQSRDCRSIMTLDGFLTRAQFECGFNSYSDEMIQKARDCAQSLSESETMKLLASGMKAFDREEKDRGRARVCQDVLRDFPGVIRK